MLEKSTCYCLRCWTNCCGAPSGLNRFSPAVLPQWLSDDCSALPRPPPDAPARCGGLADLACGRPSVAVRYGAGPGLQRALCHPAAY